MRNINQDELKDLLRKLLVLELFNLNVSHLDISRKLKINKNSVTEFLKGIKKGE